MAAVLDMASVAMGYYPTNFVLESISNPFIFDDPVQAINIVHKSYKEFLYSNKNQTNNVNYLFQQPLGSYYMTGPSPNRMLSKTKR